MVLDNEYEYETSCLDPQGLTQDESLAACSHWPKLSGLLAKPWEHETCPKLMKLIKTLLKSNVMMNLHYEIHFHTLCSILYDIHIVLLYKIFPVIKGYLMGNVIIQYDTFNNNIFLASQKQRTHQLKRNFPFGIV